MNALTRTSILAAAALALTVTSLDSQARDFGGRGGFHHGHRGWGGHGHFWGGVGIGVGLGLGTYYYGAPWYPGYAVPVYPAYSTYPVVPVAPEPVARAAPEPVIYPRNGQSASQTEADRQGCDRWAMSQPNAMADASVFHRSTLACMEGRGYTVR